MEFVCQQSSIDALSSLAKADRHSILIDGIKGCGKTHLSKLYASYIGADDFIQVVPKVAELKDCIDSCMQINNKVVICIENLDTGVIGASYTILKFLEEPASHVYIVVTCRNIQKIPDTIISRCACVSISPPTNNDIKLYAQNINTDKFRNLQFNPLMKCIQTFTDVDTVLGLTSNQLEYFHNLSSISQFKDSVTNIVWKLGHYEDNTETPIELVIRYLMEICHTKHIQQAGIECITDLLQKNIGSHAVLGKFVFECKYCE